MKCALVTVIENSTENINSNNGKFNQQRMYFEEATLCYKSWRENGGWAKDIPIYAICVTKATLSKDEQKELSKLNITYIEEFMPATETFEYGFFNVPIAMRWAEQNLPEDIFIHTDLDMTLIKPLPEIFLEMARDGFVVCGQYDENAIKDQRNTPESWDAPFDTGFMITKRVSGFYKAYSEQMLEIIENGYEGNTYDIEEYIIDRMYNESQWLPKTVMGIAGIKKYQIGEGYPSVDEFTDDEIPGILFWHEHIIYDKYYEKVKEKLKYSKRVRGLT